MQGELYEEITGALVCTYGPFQVYTLMQSRSDDLIEETHEHYLIVLVDDQDEVVEAIWHYDSRVELPWVVYAVKQRLSLQMRIIEERIENLNQVSQPDNMAKIRANLDAFIASNRISKDYMQFLSAESMVERLQLQLDRLRVDNAHLAEALRQVEAMHLEGIHDVSGEANTEYERQMQRVNDGRRKAEAWLPYVGEGITNWHTILGPLVMQAGPFRVYQSMGQFGRFTSPPRVVTSESGWSWTNPQYMILFKDDRLGTFDIWRFPYRSVPCPLQVSRPARSWFAQLNDSINAATKAIEEESNPEETLPMREALVWRKRIYLTVYDAWVALGCPDAPDDNPDPTFDPTTAAGFGTFRSGKEPTGPDSQM